LQGAKTVDSISVVKSMTLFDVFEREDESARAYSEDAFSFLNRAASAPWGRVRAELERWFELYPTDEAAELRARFRQPDPNQHIPAWWELYLFHLFQTLGFEVEVHPPLGEVNTRPDFRCRSGEDVFLVEAVATISGIEEEGREARREDPILDIINNIPNELFLVAVSFQAVGVQQPSRREITTAIQRWLSGLDPDELLARIHRWAGLVTVFVR
jgi:hypothetical protein